MNVNKLKGKIVENEMNITSLADKMGIDRSTLYRKLNNKGESLTVKEANIIVNILGLSKEESVSIFFNHHVAYRATKDKDIEEENECRI